MKIIEFLKNKNKQLLKPDLVTLVKYKVIFKTIDGEWHEYNHYNYADPKAIKCSVPEYIMIGEEYMIDDDSNMYPLKNIVCIKWEITDTIKNVIEKRHCSDIRYVFYNEDDIKIWRE